MTEESYLQDAYRCRFEANVLANVETELGVGVVLDKTYFYPGGGGQPADSGTLGGAAVVAVSRHGENIVHVCDHRIDGIVIGAIDWEGRFDHMQQHTGQHILSGALLKRCQVETTSFHLGPESSSIQLDVLGLELPALGEAEALANEIVWKNGEVRTSFMRLDEASNHDLRGAPPERDPLRVVEVEGFDRVACGGTHVARTGEIGLIKIIGVERQGHGIRLEFLCGKRGLRDYSEKHDVTAQLAKSLGTNREDLLATVARLKEVESRDRDRIRQLSGQLLALTISRLLKEAPIVQNVQIVRHVFEGWALEDVRHLVQELQQQDRCVALIAVKDEKAHLIFARSKDLAFDIRGLLADALAITGGRGGGRPDMAQGGAPSADRLQAALDFAWNALLPYLPGGRTP